MQLNSESVPEPELTIKARPRHTWRWVLIGTMILALLFGVLSVLWYRHSLAPRDAASKQTIRFTVQEGATAGVIAKQLEDDRIIQSSLSFQIFTHFTETKHKLQAGTYSLTPAMSIEEIVGKMTKGETDQLTVTILPGKTLKQLRADLQVQGFKAGEIDAAFTASYQHPLLADKPKEATLEGYIFPDTYRMPADASLQTLLELSFSTFHDRLKERSLIENFAKRKLTLHQALTLGSIIQKEVAKPADERQVAQVFYKRLAEKMPLGADATFIYGAELLGVEPRVTLDSPYNTRIIKGLPPGPIASMTLSALEAVAHPAKGDYLYFVSGDNGTTYFSRTQAEHEANTRKYCIKNCNIFNN
ncbi:MAG TPA: endolytic transglycosylase MltG [Candidatus Saccharimonadales bacterium]